MAKTYRVGVIGFAHMHINDVAAHYAEHPQVELVACADTTPDVPELRVAPYTRGWNLQNALDNIGFPRAYGCWLEMLEKEQFDIVVCCAENSKHPEIVEACAAAGVNVCVEKPMAVTYGDALRMVRACETAGTAMAVNWPITWSPSARKAAELIAAGAIGRVLEVRWRTGHQGPLGSGVAHAGVSETAEPMTGPERAATWWHQAAAGGGAMLDFCSYGALLARWYIGEPATGVMGMKANLDSQWGDAEDNAVVVARFPSAILVSEGTWTTRHNGIPSGSVIYGSDGTMVPETEGGKPVVRVETGSETAVHECEPLPEGRGDVAAEFIYHLETGEPLHPTLTPAMNLEVTAILDAGMASADSGKMEPVANASWQIG